MRFATKPPPPAFRISGLCCQLLLIWSPRALALNDPLVDVQSVQGDVVDQQAIDEAAQKVTDRLTGAMHVCDCHCCEAVRRLPSDPPEVGHLDFKCTARMDDSTNEANATAANVTTPTDLDLTCPAFCSTAGAEGSNHLAEFENTLRSTTALTFHYCYVVCVPTQAMVAASCAARPPDPTENYVPPVHTQADPCVDDPMGLVASQGTDCAHLLATNGCDRLVRDLRGKTYNTWELCPDSCGKCGPLGGDAKPSESAATGPYVPHFGFRGLLPDQAPKKKPISYKHLQKSIMDATLAVEGSAARAEAAAAAARKQIKEFDPDAAVQALRPAGLPSTAGFAPSPPGAVVVGPGPAPGPAAALVQASSGESPQARLRLRRRRLGV